MITTTIINVATVTSTTITTTTAAATSTTTFTSTSTSASKRSMMWSLCVTLLLCVVPLISAANEARLTSLQVKLSRSPNAKCSDGTPATYYWKQATGPKDGIDHSNMWIIGLDDGHPIESPDPPYPWIPACVNPLTCIWRQDYYKPYVTTVAPGVDREIGGIFSTDSVTNAPFTRANLGLIHYCSNDLWMGMNGDVTVNGKSFLFRGQAIIDGVLDDIINRYPAILSKSAQIIFFGTGFGGLALSTHIDHMCAKFPQSVRCGGVIDGGIYVQPVDIGPQATGLVEFMKLGWPIWQPSLTDTQCVISNPSYPTSPHTCALPPTSLQYHTAPLFVLQSLSDFSAVQLMGYSSSSNNAVLTEMATLTYQSLCGVTAAAGYYAPSCSVHSYLFSSAFTIAFFTTTPMQSLDTWFRAVGRPVLTNGPYGCNSRCQSLPGTFPNATRCNSMAPTRCTSTPPPRPTNSPTDIPTFNNIVAVAIANIWPSTQTPTSQVYGTALFEQDGTSRLTRVTLRIMNLPAKPGGYGVHIHTYGDVDNLGVHYNPTNKTHGCGMYATRHIGDVGTILNSTAMSTPPPEEMLYSELLDLGTYTNMSIIGRSIVIHAISDPCFSGGPTGPYMAQGIIGIGNSGTDTNVAKQNPFPSTITAFARMVNSSGLQTGGLRFSQPNAGRIRINGTISGFAPNSQHGIHIRTYGDVSSNIAGGGIFNPMGKPHGLPANGVNRPAGSLGNVQAGSDGVIRIDTEVGTELITLHTQSVGILGRVIAIDSTPDTGSAMNLMIPVSWGVIGLSSTMLVDPNAPTTMTPTTMTPTTMTPTTMTPTTVTPTTVTPTTSTTTTVPTTTAPTTSTTTNAPTGTPTPSTPGSSIPVTPVSSTGSGSSTSTSPSTESSTGTGIGVIPSLPPSSTTDPSNPSINRTLGIKHVIYLGSASHISISMWVLSFVVFLVTFVNLW